MDENLDIWALIVSYLVLGAFLLYHRFYGWCYGCLCWLAAAFLVACNHLYDPVETALVLPHILAVCVCYLLWNYCYTALQNDQLQSSIVDSNVESNCPLYIGERTTSMLVKTELDLKSPSEFHN